MRHVPAMLLPLLLAACDPVPRPITALPDLGPAADVAPAHASSDQSAPPDLGRAMDAASDLAEPARDLARPADLAQAPDLSPASDLSPSPDLIPAPDLTPPAPDLVQVQCGDFGMKPCANWQCHNGMHSLVDGDMCGVQVARQCVMLMNCGSAGLIPCDDFGNPSQFGHCAVGLRAFAGKCIACL